MSAKRIAPSITPTKLVKAAETVQATATTIAFRWPQFIYDVLDPTHQMSAETRRAFTEKTTALMEGSVVAIQAWQRLWIEMMFGKIGPQDFPKKILSITNQSATPARQRVRANAKRLTAKHLTTKRLSGKSSR